MADKRKPKSAAGAAKHAPKTKKPAARTKEPSAKTMKAKAKTAAAPAKERAQKLAPEAKKTVAKSKKSLAKTRKHAVNAEAEAGYRIGEPVLDPIGDVSSGEGRTYLGDAEPLAEAETEASSAERVAGARVAALEVGSGMAAQAASESGVGEAEGGRAAKGAGAEGDEGEHEAGAEAQPPRLERLQKILSRAGIASRRRAEEMIVAGRVMVNGQVVTQLGSKADPARDHIRVDGKLIQGAERHRYFVLNKPRGYVTTVSDPEGRPTVMQFFAKMHERLYPVGRLDYQSEGLLLMTNDGELANLLTKAESGVEKTYLVKVAGQPSEEQLERLRGGVAIEKGYAGSARVRTAPARIRKVREGENPWYEVVLTEGRNRELRKMFAAIGHFAEKIRRVGYGPLALDVEPGKLRELTPDEVNALRLTAEGKMKPRRIRTDQMLPREAGQAAEKRDKGAQRRDREAGRRDDGAKRRFGRAEGRFGRKERRGEKPGGRGERPWWQREGRTPKKEWRPRGQEFRGREFRGEEKSRPEFRRGPRQEQGENRFGEARRPFTPHGERPSFERGERWDWKRGSQGKKRFEGGRGKGGKFDAKTGRFTMYRGDGGRGRRFSGSRPGAQRGGWKREARGRKSDS